MIRTEDIAAAYRHVFATPEGEIVLEDLMNMHYINRSTFEQPNDPATLIAYREGGKNAVLRILALAEKRLVAESE